MTTTRLIDNILEKHTSSGTGFRFSLMYPTEGGINALRFPAVPALQF